MPNQKNLNQVKDLKEAFQNSKAVVLSDYSGMSVADQTTLRAAVVSAGGKFQVVKNTLIRLALKDRLNDLPQELLDATQGPSAILTTPIDDPVSPTKALYAFIKDNETPTVKLAILDDRILSPEQVKSLSQLPGREQLLGMLVGQLNAPISGFAQVLRANLQNLVYALDAIKNQQS